MMHTTYDVIEIFDSIQGEGVHMGYPTTFIRMAGCNLVCPWCDTKESWLKTNAKKMTKKQIVEACNKDFVVITGGEPCLQPIDDIIRSLRNLGKKVAIETNGTLPTPIAANWITCSPKPPEYFIHPLCDFDELKFVVTEDFDPAIIKKLTRGCNNIWLQPEGGDMENMVAKAYKIAMNEPGETVRVGVQLHKIYKLK